MTPRGHHWTGALLVALAMHGVVLAVWLAGDVSEGARAAGRDGLQVSVGLAGSFAEPARDAQSEDAPSDHSDDAETMPPAAVEAEIETQPEAEPEVQHEERPQPQPDLPDHPAPESPEQPQPPEPAPTREPSLQDKPADAERPVEQAPRTRAPQPEHKPQAPAKPKPKPKPKPTERQQPDAQPRESQETAVDETVVDASSKPQRSSVKATGTGQRVETGGNPAARQSYLAEVLARIARHKRYPRAARHDGVTGVVTVTFTVLANGSVRTQQVTGSSGDHRLDQAALDMLSRASPLPPIPRDMGMSSLELTLPVEFSLNQKRKIF